MTEQVKQIAQRLVGLREAEDVTSEELAKIIGVPFETYIKYEKAEEDIPVSVLYDVAGHFGLELTELLSGSAPKLKDFSFIKSGKGLKMHRRKEYEYQSLSYNFAHAHSEALLVTVPVSGENEPMAETIHSGQEFNYMLEGRMEIMINKKRVILEPGDSLYFDSSYPHGMRALDGKPAKFVCVIMR
ncbi:MAG: helix-turn-helix transcriptional regulator [Clostridia bacterium]|nr:helix-turn-helix transcriptional regulator [Clostridia bacterium]